MPVNGAGYVGDYAEDYATLNLKFTSYSTAWVPVALAGTPVVKVYAANETGTEVTTGITLSVDFDGVVGLNNVLIDLSSAAFYAVAKDYHVIITTGTIDGVSAVGTVIGSFSIENRFVEVDVAKWLGTAVGAGTAGIPNVDVTRIINSSVPANVLGGWLREGRSGTAGSGTTTTLVDAARIEIDDYWNGALLIFRSGTNIGFTAVVTDFDAASDTIIFTPALPNAVTTEGYVLVPGLGYSDIQAISGDLGAAVNLKSIYDGTGYIADTAPASRSQVDNIGAASGGAINFAPIHDNTITDTIDNAAAVDKGGGLVGIPVTSHAFIAGNEVTIAGTTNYNTVEEIVSQTTNEVVITATYQAETFGGSETIISTIKAIKFVGSVTSGTFADTGPGTASSHSINDVDDDIDIVYGYQVGGGRIATNLNINADVDGGQDQLGVEVYDHVGSAWDVLGEIDDNDILNIPLTIKYTGTGSELGRVYVRYDLNNADTPANLEVFECIVAAVSIGQTVGYGNGQIWGNTNASNTNTEPFVDGVADNPVSTLVAMKTLSTAIGLNDFHLINGSSITLAESTVMESYFGDNWTLALGGQDVDGAYFQGAHVTGIGTSSTEVHYEGCDVGTMSVQIGHFDFCAFSGTVTMTLAGDYEFHNCYSNVAGAGAPTFTKTSGQAITAEWRNWMDSITVSGLQSGDTITINGRLGTVTLNGADANVEIRGSYKSIVNNLTGSPTVNIDGAWKGSDIADTLADTNELQADDVPWLIAAIQNDTDDLQMQIGTAGNGLTGIPWNVAWDGEVESEVNDALDTAISELGVAAPAATPTIRTALMLMYMALRNKIVVQTSGTDALELHNDAGTKIAAKVLTDDGMDYTEKEMM